MAPRVLGFAVTAAGALLGVGLGVALGTTTGPAAGPAAGPVVAASSAAAIASAPAAEIDAVLLADGADEPIDAPTDEPADGSDEPFDSQTSSRTTSQTSSDTTSHTTSHTSSRTEQLADGWSLPRLQRACDRIPNLITRAERLQDRLSAPASTRGSLADLKARIAAAERAGDAERATALTHRLTVRQDLQKLLPGRIDQLTKARSGLCVDVAAAMRST